MRSSPLFLIALGLAALPLASSFATLHSDSEDVGMAKHYWTKSGLEQIPFKSWSAFSPDEIIRPFVADIPWPGDNFTEMHLVRTVSTATASPPPPSPPPPCPLPSQPSPSPHIPLLCSRLLRTLGTRR